MLHDLKKISSFNMTWLSSNCPREHCRFNIDVMLNISHPLSGGCDACLSIRRQGIWCCQRRGVLPKLSLCLDLCKIIERQECILWPLPWLESRLLETLWCIRLSAGEVVNFENEAKLSPRHDMQQQPQPHVMIMAMVTWWCDDMVVTAKIKMMLH